MIFLNYYTIGVGTDGQFKKVLFVGPDLSIACAGPELVMQVQQAVLKYSEIDNVTALAFGEDEKNVFLPSQKYGWRYCMTNGWAFVGDFAIFKSNSNKVDDFIQYLEQEICVKK